MDDALDLHTFKPAEAADLVAEYLRAAQEAGLAQVRIIHGKGTGRMRATVEAALRAHPAVAGFGTAPDYLGGWGATLVSLRPLGAAGEPAAQPAPPPSPAAPPARGGGRRRLVALYLRLSPVAAILVGVAMAARMRTNYDQVRWLLVALAAVLGLLLVARLRAGWRAPLHRAARLVFTNIAWFTVPFYLRSAAADKLHWASLVPLAALVFLWEWAPWRRRIEARRAGRAALRSLTVFYLLNMGLPTAAGLPLAPAWWLACGAAGSFFVVSGLRRPAARAAAALALAAAAVLWRPWFPPVPMVVKAMAWEPAISGALAAPPPSLTLQVAVFAPQGLRERLVHVWVHDGEVTDRIPLDVAGGRQEGFRTRSRKQHWPADPAGRWRVELRTEDGRRLGESGFEIKARNSGATLVE